MDDSGLHLLREKDKRIRAYKEELKFYKNLIWRLTGETEIEILTGEEDGPPENDAIDALCRSLLSD